jgi:RNA polymerase subunit RPABC4/transcription elongation factor Spt4
LEDLGILVALIAGVWAVLLWLSIIVWVYRDIRERTRDLGLQVLAVFVAIMFFPGFNIPGLALYLMLRPRESLEESYARSLEEEALLREIGDEGMCPSCRRFVERGWRLCPFCATQLKDVCVKCSQLLSFNWVACPFCGTERRGYGIAEARPNVPAAPVASVGAPAEARVSPTSARPQGQPRHAPPRMPQTADGPEDGPMLGDPLD